jgi:ATP-dependent DNA helicase RecQ
MSFGAVHLIDVLRGKATDKVAQHGPPAAVHLGHRRRPVRGAMALGAAPAGRAGPPARRGRIQHAGPEPECARGAARRSATAAARAGGRPKRGDRGERGRGARGAAAAKAPPLPLDEAALRRFDALKAWRAEVAKSHNLPAYVVFHDATLAQMARDNPRALAALSEVSGVGEKKLQAYGDEILRVLRAASTG